jgi:GT2 family glycosyltransferase
VVYDVNWLSEILKVQRLNPDIASFSPYDALANKIPKEEIESQDYILGHKIQRHITGWCLVVSDKVIKIIKKLDERFSFYYADNDYAMSLIKYNFKHALVTKAIAHHLESVSSKTIREKKAITLHPKTPKYIIRENWTWVLENEKMMEDLITFHNKWGNRKVIKLKLFFAQKLSSLRLGYLNRFIV